MNKISKKIVALVTMAAFVLTLVPFAAFAAGTASSVQTAEKDYTVTMSAEEASKATVSATVDVVGNDANHNVYVWLTDENGYYRYATVVLNGSGESVKSDATVTAGANGFVGAAVIETASATKHNVVFQVSKAGKYTVHAGVALGTANSVNDLVPIDAAAGYSNEVTVNAAESYVESVTVSGSNVSSNELDYIDGAVPNGITADSVTVNVASKYTEATTTTAPSAGKVVSISNPYANIHVQDAEGNDLDELTLEANTANVNILADSGTREGVYTIKFTVDNKTCELKVKIGGAQSEAKSIAAVKMDNDVVSSKTAAGSTLEKVVQFVVKDDNGTAMNVAQLTANKEKAAKDGQTSASDTTHNIKILSAPKNSTAYFQLAAPTNDADVVTLKIKGGDLKVGDYTVRVALDSGASVDVSFTVKSFGTATDMKIEVVGNNDAEESSQLPMNTKSNATYTIKAFWVDENGVEEEATDAVLGIRAEDGVSYNSGTLTIDKLVKGGTSDNSSLIGSTVTVYAIDSVNGFSKDRAFTIVDPAVAEGVGLAFDKNAGDVEKNNAVKATVVDKDGNVVKLASATVKAYVASKSNEDAYVEVVPGSYSNGEAALTVYADQETSADIVVAVVDGQNNYYGGTLTYTFGEKDVTADNTVVMTIGSNDFVVNNNVVTVEDAAPYIANDRTYVPFRALGEAIGADVVWDNDARTVTYTAGKTTIVMTIGETTYTVNGEEKTMDVAPEITNDRTYVPVRFVGEALGFKVTALYAEDGTTASVVFQK